MLRLSWLMMLHLWWVLFFCFVLCCRLLCREREREENIGCFHYFLKKSQQLFYQSYKSVTQSKKYDSTVYFSHWYLFIGHLYVYFFSWFVFYLFLCVLLFCGGQTGLKVEELVCHWLFYRCVQKNKYHHTNKQTVGSVD